MDAQTISAAQGASTAAPSTETEITLTSDLANKLKIELGNRSQECLEQECRELIKTTARSMFELGMRLLFIREGVAPEEWLLVLHRIGIGYDAAKRMMATAIRFGSLPSCDRIIEASKSKSKLIELLVLDDTELARLNQGDTIREISLTTLPKTTVLALRSTLRDNAPEPATAPVKPEQVPVAPPSASALLGDAAEVAEEFQAVVTASRHAWDAASDTPVTDTRAWCAAIQKKTGRLPNKLMLSANILAWLADNPEVRSYLPINQEGPATISQLKILLGVAEIEINEAVKPPRLTYDPSVTELLGNAAATPAPISGNIDPGAEPLEPGDRVQSLHAARLGRVVRTYADGSASVCWDDGEPQPEGLGHERMPRHLLIRIDQETVSADAGKACITREEAMLISEALIASLRKNGAKRLLSVEDTVEMMLTNGVIQCECFDPTAGETATASIGTIISDLRIYGLHPDQLLSPESDGDQAELRAILDTQAKAYAKAHDVSYAEAVGTVFGEAAANLLSGEPSETATPFSGCIDPGNNLFVRRHPEVPDQADDLQALPSVYSMTHGYFDGANVTLMIHAGKTWMIAEEIAAVLGETPEQVAEIEEIIGQHFTAARKPEAYAKVRIASTALAARLLDAYAIHLLDVVLNTPASSALVAWMDGLAKIEGAAEASPLPTSDEPTLSQNFSQLEVLHGMAWDMMDQVTSQIAALRVVLMEQESDPGSVAASIHPETLASVAAKLIADHNELCDDMGKVTRDIHEQVFKKGESLPESVWLELVSELSKQRDALSREDMWKISSVATNLLPFANSSPEVGAALGNLVGYAKRHGALLYHHEATGTMGSKWLPGHHPAARPRASATH